MLRNTKTLRRRMPLESRSLHLTRKINRVDESKTQQKNQTGRGPDDNIAEQSPLTTTAPMTSSVPAMTPASAPASAPASVPETTPTPDTGGFLKNITNMIPGLGGTGEEKEEAEDTVEDTVVEGSEDEQPQSETADSDESRKSLLSEGLDDVRKKYSEFYGVAEDDIVIAEGDDDITKTGESTLIVGTDSQTKFAKNLKKGERVAVLFGITPGLKGGLLVYPDYETVKTASTGNEMYNSRVVFDKLTVPFDDVKPGYSVKILVCYIETIAPVVEGEPLRLPYIPSISIVKYTTKEIKNFDESESAEEEEELEPEEETEVQQNGQEGDTFTGSLEPRDEEDDLTSTLESNGLLEEEESGL